jgi:dolichyl-phosphate-mannose-protein mannosyltransferase
VEDQTLTSSPLSNSRRREFLLLLLFLVSLPFLNPWIRGDGVGYYAFARAPLIEHSFDFTHDYQHANLSFRDARLDESGQPKPFFRTPTGRLDNHFTVGPAILWSPFLLLTHAGVHLARALGSSVPADGFSAPYRISIAFATALYGFLSLWLAFRITRQYVEERSALLATLSIWWASSLPVYMYFNPSWSHAHSAFAAALFIWYWHETRTSRSLAQWLLLGLIAGLMLDVYYANAAILIILAVEAIPQYISALRRDSHASVGKPAFSKLLLSHFFFAFILLISILPTFITRYIIYGNAFESGYIPLRAWLWSSPAFLTVLFSSNHGLFLWTPVVLLSVLGLFLFWRRMPGLGAPLLAACVAFYVFIACYPDWAGVSSYGNRFFVSLTSLFVLGLAVFLDRLSHLLHSRKAAFAAAAVPMALLLLWNAGLMFQWGSRLIPARGPVSFSEVAYNQFFVVPHQLSGNLYRYFFKRKALMEQIEQRDIQQLEKNPLP